MPLTGWLLFYFRHMIWPVGAKIDSNWVPSNLADRKELQGAVQNKKTYRQKGVGARKLHRAKRWAGYCKITFFFFSGWQRSISQIT